MLLSIIIPTFNEESYLPALLHSLKSQRYSEYEIIVSDGNSSDRTREIAKEYGARVVTSIARSPAVQRNVGAKVANGELLLFLDADSTINTKKFLRLALDEFHDRSLDIAGFMVKWDGKKLRYRLLDWYYSFCSRFLTFLTPFTPGAAILVRKELHEISGGFSTKLFIGEDHDYGIRLAKKGKFGSLKSVSIYSSVRRFEKEGFVLTHYKWVNAIVQRYLRGKVDKNFDYEYGKYD